MPLRTLTAKAATSLDAELLSTGAFSLDQLMELAGLSISQALLKFSPPSLTPRVLVACGPGNNGGDGLVAARHLHLFGYSPRVFYPKPGRHEIYARLRKQLEGLRVPFVKIDHDDDGDEGRQFERELDAADVVVDAIFGFSFSGGEIREPFKRVLEVLARTEKRVLAVDAPSGWDIERGPMREEGEEEKGRGCYMPSALISLTAPKPLIRWFEGRHFVGGRFVGREVAERYGFDVPDYEGGEQVVEVENERVGGGGERL